MVQSSRAVVRSAVGIVGVSKRRDAHLGRRRVLQRLHCGDVAVVGRVDEVRGRRDSCEFDQGARQASSCSLSRQARQGLFVYSFSVLKKGSSFSRVERVGGRQVCI